MTPTFITAAFAVPCLVVGLLTIVKVAKAWRDPLA